MKIRKENHLQREDIYLTDKMERVNQKPLRTMLKSKTKLALSIIVPTTRGRARYLRMLLSSLLKADISVEECEIIVICDEKDEAIKQAVKEFSASRKYPISFIENKARVGASKARNIGIGNAKGSLLTFFDDDVIIDPSCFKNVIKHFVKNSKVGCVVGRSLITPLSFTSGEEIKTLWNLAKQGRLYNGGLSGCNMTFSRDAIEKLEGFDERLGVYSFSEDVDVFMRFNSTGYKLVYDKEALVIHFKAPLGGVRARNSLDSMYYAVRNDTYVYAKNKKWPLHMVYILRKLMKRFKIYLHNERVSPKCIVKIISGLIDGYQMSRVYRT